ncbi:MAG TPA: GTPase Era [bacterium]|nr:GTPase Era [bacterium]
MLKETLAHSGFVAVIGAPNTGKSTFLNTALGKKVSIVSPKVQTTRNAIRGIHTTDDAQIVFVDTPGITADDFGKMLNDWMNRTAYSKAHEADAVLLFVDVTTQHPEQGPGKEELEIIGKLKVACPVFLVANKVDAVKKMRADDTLAVIGKQYPFAGTFTISALNGTGVPELLTAITNLLPPGPQYFEAEDPSDQSDEFLAAEIIREKMYGLLQYELPYHTAVVVEQIVDHEQVANMLVIHATINVARKSQKAIVIGEKGKMLKEIGTQARIELQTLFNKKIHLELHVRIEENWFASERSLKKLGFEKDFDA